MIAKPTFDSSGEYVLDTLEQRAAAMYSALHSVLQMAHENGADSLVSMGAMYDVANNMLTAIARADGAKLRFAMERVAAVLDDRRGFHVSNLDPEDRVSLLAEVVAAARGDS